MATGASGFFFVSPTDDIFAAGTSHPLLVLEPGDEITVSIGMADSHADPWTTVDLRILQGIGLTGLSDTGTDSVTLLVQHGQSFGAETIGTKKYLITINDTHPWILDFGTAPGLNRFSHGEPYFAWVTVDVGSFEHPEQPPEPPRPPPLLTALQKAEFSQAAHEIGEFTRGVNLLNASTNPLSPGTLLITQGLSQLTTAINPTVGAVNTAAQLSVAVVDWALINAPLNPIGITLLTTSVINMMTKWLLERLAADPPDLNYAEVYHAPALNFAGISGASAEANALVAKSYSLMQTSLDMLAATERFEGAALAGNDVSQAAQESAFNASLQQFAAGEHDLANALHVYLSELQNSIPDANFSNDTNLADVQAYLAGLANPVSDDPFLASVLAAFSAEVSPLSIAFQSALDDAVDAIINEQDVPQSGSVFASLQEVAGYFGSVVGSGDDTIVAELGGGGHTYDGKAGNDTIDYSAATQGIVVNLSASADQATGPEIGINQLISIENVIGGAGNDAITGNAVANTLNGGPGADTLIGGEGNDVYVVDNAGDGVAENASEGNDAVFSSINYSLAPNVESLILQGSANLQGYGNASDNTLYGNTGNNLLDGGAGADAMYGGAGNEVYFVDSSSDAVFENAGEGNDSVFASANYTLSANVENLIMQGSADLQGYGNGDANVLYGNSGNNLLNGNGDVDLMVGGAGNDIYFTDDPSDSCFEVAGQGNDTVFASSSYGLAADIENLILQGSADLQGYGNNQANVIYGNSGNNLINAAGGVDLMVGGAGNDTYFVDDPSDSCFEVAGEGNDAVFASCNYGLAAEVETLVMQGSGDYQGYGSNQANTLYGNSGNNLLNGAGGADTMLGGAGHDTYFVDNVGDVVFENSGEGTDAVFASVNYTLTANVEALVLQGSANIAGTGNGIANSLFGNSGDNALDGGAGADSLTGNAGNDIFVFNVGQAGSDTINDFAGNDAAQGDSLKFVGYGADATFTNIDATHWQVNYNAGTQHEIITFGNGAAIDASDYSFI